MTACRRMDASNAPDAILPCRISSSIDRRAIRRTMRGASGGIRMRGETSAKRHVNLPLWRHLNSPALSTLIELPSWLPSQLVSTKPQSCKKSKGCHVLKPGLPASKDLLHCPAKIDVVWHPRLAHFRAGRTVEPYTKYPADRLERYWRTPVLIPEVSR